MLCHIREVANKYIYGTDYTNVDDSTYKLGQISPLLASFLLHFVLFGRAL